MIKNVVKYLKSFQKDLVSLLILTGIVYRPDGELTVQPVSMQNLFIALCGDEN